VLQISTFFLEVLGCWEQPPLQRPGIDCFRAGIDEDEDHFFQGAGGVFEVRLIFFAPTAKLEKNDHPRIRDFLAMDRVARA
jgi:hypothetical protein